MKIFILALFSVFLNFESSSQTLIPRFESLGVNEGLPHSSVYSILQDKQGFMWFGTADGLCRYDGSRLLTFKYKAKHGQDVVNNFVKSKMLEDAKGNIWYSNQTGIYKWNIFSQSVEKVKPLSIKDYKGSIFLPQHIDESGNIWFFNLLYGVCEFNIISNSFTIYPLPYTPEYKSIMPIYSQTDRKGNIWINIGDKKDPYLLFDIKIRKYSEQLKADPPHAIFFSEEGHILAYNEKLIYINEFTGTKTSIIKTLNGKQIEFFSYDGLRDNYGRLWMTARGNGLFYYDEKDNNFHKFHHQNSKLKSLPFDISTCLFIDRNENLWIGLDGGGVAKLDLKQPKFNLFPLSEGDYPILNDYFTKCFFEDGKSRIWFGTQNNGFNIYDPASGELKNFHHEKDRKNSLPGNMVGSIIQDREGNMWIGSSGGISIFNEDNESFKTIEIRDLPPISPLLNNLIYKIIQLADGDFLAATIEGIVRFGKNEFGEFEGIYFKENPYFRSVTTDVVEMPDKSIFATLPGIGLFYFEANGKAYTLKSKFFEGVDIRSLRKDEQDVSYLWLGTGKGLIHFNILSKEHQLFDEKSGLANSYVYGSLEDTTGNLWISTNKGLSNYIKAESKFHNYSFEDGLQSNEFNTQALYKSKGGNFYFGGIKGFNWFKAEQQKVKQMAPVAALTGVEINGFSFQNDSSFGARRSITVPYFKNDFNFEFAALDYTRPEANNILYILDGWDSDWISSVDGTARYANLAPGNYTLKLKVSNASGMWSSEEHFNIVIGYPFWQRAWFMIMIAVFLITAVILITQQLSRQKAQRKLRLLEKQIAVNAERNRISADMHDEIGIGITHIALLSEIIQARQKEGDELQKDIKTISISARKLVQTMSEIIWALNPQNDTLENLLAYIREQSRQYFDAMNVEFTICFPDEVPDIKLSNEQRRNLYLVTREALNNAMKHSKARSINLKMEIDRKRFCFSVTDDGIGFNSPVVKAGNNGILNMKKRMNEIGGSIEWLALEKGTKVEYCL